MHLCLCRAQLIKPPAAHHFLTSYAQQAVLVTNIFPIVRSQVLIVDSDLTGIFRTDFRPSEPLWNINVLFKLLLQELNSLVNFRPPSHLAVFGLTVIIYKSKTIAYEPMVSY